MAVFVLQTKIDTYQNAFGGIHGGHATQKDTFGGPDGLSTHGIAGPSSARPPEHNPSSVVPTCDVPGDVLAFEDTLNTSIPIAPDRFENCSRESLILFKDSDTLVNLVNLHELGLLGELGERLNILLEMLHEAMQASSARKPNG